MIVSREFERLRQEHNWAIEEHAVLRGSVWETEAAGARAVSYAEAGNELCAQVEENSFWFRHRNAVIRGLVRGARNPPALWEIGAGNGSVSLALSEMNIDTVPVEPNRAGAETAAERGLSNSICGFFEDLELPDCSIPAVGAFDVIEHIELPEKTVAEMSRVLLPGGAAIVTVPGMPALWSQCDEIAGHYRRYRPAELDRLFSKAGLEKARSGYFMMPLAPAVYFKRAQPYARGIRISDSELMQEALGDLAPKPWSPLLTALQASLCIERMLLPVFSPPFGSSIFGLYRKPL